MRTWTQVNMYTNENEKENEIMNIKSVHELPRHYLFTFFVLFSPTKIYFSDPLRWSLEKYTEINVTSTFTRRFSLPCECVCMRSSVRACARPCIRASVRSRVLAFGHPHIRIMCVICTYELRIYVQTHIYAFVYWTCPIFRRTAGGGGGLKSIWGNITSKRLQIGSLMTH